MRRLVGEGLCVVVGAAYTVYGTLAPAPYILALGLVILGAPVAGRIGVGRGREEPTAMDVALGRVKEAYARGDLDDLDLDASLEHALGGGRIDKLGRPCAPGGIMAQNFTTIYAESFSAPIFDEGASARVPLIPPRTVTAHERTDYAIKGLGLSYDEASRALAHVTASRFYGDQIKAAHAVPPVTLNEESL